MKKQFFTAAAFAALAFTAVNVHAETLNDGQIAQVVLTADQSQIDVGTLAIGAATDPLVKAYAEKSTLEATNHLAAVTSLVQTAGLTLEESATNTSLKEDTGKSLEDIKTQKGAEFDKAYIDNQVMILQNFMDGLDNSLIPQAQNEELKAILGVARATVETHFNEAKALQQKLNQPPAP